MAEHELRIVDFWNALKKFWYWIVLVALLLGAVVGVYTSRYSPKEYTSTVAYDIVVDSTNDELDLNAIRNELTLRVASMSGIANVLLTTGKTGALSYFIGHLESQGYDVNDKSVSLSLAPRNTANLDTDLIYAINVTINADDPIIAEKLAETVTLKVNDLLKEKSSVRGVSLEELQAPSPAVAVRPYLAKNVAIAVLFGALLTYVVCFVLFIMNDAILKNDLEALDAPLLARVPKKKWACACKKKNVSADGTSDFEAYRIMRTNLLYAFREEKSFVCGVVSAKKNDKKDVNAANLAIAFSKIGRKTVLVDADMRSPSQDAFFGVENGAHGLTDYLLGEDGTPALQKVNDEGLMLLTSGTKVDDPTIILHSARFEELLTKLKEEYDNIILLLPPMQAYSDAMIVADKVDGMVLVAEVGKSKRTDVATVVRKLRDIDAHLIGTVENGSAV